MPQPTKGARLGGSPAHQRLILANLATSLFQHGKITTTEAKAKRLRPYAERLITKAKRGDLHNRREIQKVIRDRETVHRLMHEIGPFFADRNGGYTRITKTLARQGDNAPMAVIELVSQKTVTDEADRARRVAGSQRRQPATAAAPAAEALRPPRRRARPPGRTPSTRPRALRRPRPRRPTHRLRTARPPRHRPRRAPRPRTRRTARAATPRWPTRPRRRRASRSRATRTRRSTTSPSRRTTGGPWPRSGSRRRRPPRPPGSSRLHRGPEPPARERARRPPNACPRSRRRRRGLLGGVGDGGLVAVPAAFPGAPRPEPRRTARFRLDIAYDGTDFSGWAAQPGRRTVAGVLTDALAVVLRMPVALTVAGRTDAGVHATGQVALADLPADLDPAWAVRRLARLLPADVRVTAVTPVPVEFDARFAALRRHYRLPDRHRALGRGPAARPRHAGLAASAGPRRRQRRRPPGCSASTTSPRSASAGRARPRCGRCSAWTGPASRTGSSRSPVSADAFCHSMVRSLVGALLDVGRGRRAVEWPAALLGRARAGVGRRGGARARADARRRRLPGGRRAGRPGRR